MRQSQNATPSPLVLDIGNRCPRHAVSLGNALAGFATCKPDPNVSNVIICQPGVWVLFARHMACSAVSFSVCRVFHCSASPEIVKACIGWVPVQVPRLHSGWARAVLRFKRKTMNLPKNGLVSAATNTDNWIPLAILDWFDCVPFGAENGRGTPASKPYPLPARFDLRSVWVVRAAVAGALSKKNSGRIVGHSASNRAGCTPRRVRSARGLSFYQRASEAATCQ